MILRNRFCFLSCLAFIFMVLVSSCKKEWPIPELSIVSPAENTSVRPGDRLNVQINFSSDEDEVNLTMGIVDETLLPVGPKQSWAASGTESNRSIEIPDRTYTSRNIFIKVEIDDGKETNTSFLKLNLLLEQRDVEGFIFHSRDGLEHTIEVESETGVEILSLSFSDEELTCAVVNDHLLIIGQKNVGIRCYDLSTAELAWSYPLKEEIMCWTIAQEKLWMVERGFGMKSFDCYSGSEFSRIPLSRPEFQKNIAVSQEYVLFLEDHSGSQDRLQLNFSETGFVFQDFLVNAKFDDIWVGEFGEILLGQRTNDDLYFYEYRVASNDIQDLNEPSRSFLGIKDYNIKQNYEWMFILRYDQVEDEDKLWMSRGKSGQSEAFVDNDIMSFHPSTSSPFFTIQDNAGNCDRVSLEFGVPNGNSFILGSQKTQNFYDVLSY